MVKAKTELPLSEGVAVKITAIKSYMTRFDQRPRVLVKIETNEGISGWGEAYNHGPDRSIPPIVDYIFEMIQGEDPRRIEFIMQKLYQQFRFPPGLLPEGIANRIIPSSLQ